MPNPYKQLLRYTLILGKPYAWVLVSGRHRLVPVESRPLDVELTVDTTQALQSLDRLQSAIASGHGE